ncbi:MAG: prolipoprotein diacylglyceryl transferase [Verrucomicrobiales bacterium]|nr:prolipoprotein diacylglyceryl transferase [Verrucomicrobiales bacterium]
MHPILFHLGSFPVHAYGVMTALAFVLGLWTATLRGRRVNISGEIIADVTLWVMVGTIIGARTVYVVTYWKDEFAGQPLSEIFAIWHGGLVYYGGLIGASLAGITYLRWKKLALWKIADVMAPSIALGSVFGRIGCLLNGCCYGRACDAPWAISFPPGNPLGSPTTPVHPTEIYDALLNFALYLFLAWLFRRKKFDGQIFAAYLICYAITRSFVEYFRGDYNDAHHHFGLTPAQLVSVPIFVTGLALAVILSRRTEIKRG